MAVLNTHRSLLLSHLPGAQDQSSQELTVKSKSPSWDHLRIKVDHGCVMALAHWKDPCLYQGSTHLSRGKVVSRRKGVLTNASNMG